MENQPPKPLNIANFTLDSLQIILIPLTQHVLVIYFTFVPLSCHHLYRTQERVNQ